MNDNTMAGAKNNNRSDGEQQQQQQQQQQNDLPPHSSSPDEELQRILSALETVFFVAAPTNISSTSTTHSTGNTASVPNTIQCRELADRYLTSFQRQPIAWIVCDRILGMPYVSSPTNPSFNLTPQSHFFAAQTLHSKCRNCYAVKGQLPAEALPSLRDSLFQHLMARYSSPSSAATTATTLAPGNSQQDGPVHTRLAMAFSALAIQMGWKEIIPYLLEQVQILHSQTVVSQYPSTPQQQQQQEKEHRLEAMIRITLDILRFLPEECNSDRLLLEKDEEERKWFYCTVFLHPMDDKDSHGKSVKDEKDAEEQFKQQSSTSSLSKGNAQHVLDFLWFLVQRYYTHSPQYSPQQPGLSTPPSSVSTQPIKILEKVLQCFHSWIYHVKLPPELLEQTSLLPWIFTLLHERYNTSTNRHATNTKILIDDDMMELVVDVIVEILRCYPSDSQANMALVHKMLPLVMSLGINQENQSRTIMSPFHFVLQEQQEDEMRIFCRVFTEMGESYLSLIMGFKDYNQVNLVDLILTCSSIPDPEIACITLNFWYRFVSCLEETEPYEYRQFQIENFTPQLIKLVTICTTLIQYPDDIDSLSQDKIDDIIKDRSYITDTLEDCCRLLGDNIVLTSLGTRLRVECERISTLAPHSQLEQWHGIESCLFALQSTSRYTASNEAKVLPFVFTIIPQLPSSVVHLRNTSSIIVGKYASWLERNQEYLQPILPYLANGLSIPRCASSSAKAIKELCEHCSTKLQLGDSVLELYDGIMTAQQNQQILDLRDELEVLEGACIAVSMQLNEAVHNGGTPELIAAYVSRLVQPIGARLANTAASSCTSATSPRLVLNELDRLTVVIRFLHVPSLSNVSMATGIIMSSRAKFLTNLMVQIWPWLDTIHQKFPKDFNVAERLCRLHKHVIRGCGAAGYQDMIQSLCTNIVRNYVQSHLSPYLYLASICVSEYGNDQRLTQLLFDMVKELCDNTFTFLRSPDDLIAQPDVVEELFFLAGRMMTHCPVPMILSPLLLSLMTFGTICIRLDHKDANRGTLNFMESTLSYGLNLNANKSNVESCRESLEACIRAEGRQIVHSLVQSLMGNLPCYRIDNGHGSVGGILYKLTQLCPSLLWEWMSEALQQAPELARSRMLRDIMNPPSSDEFMSSVRWFSNFCFRDKKMRRES